MKIKTILGKFYPLTIRRFDHFFAKFQLELDKQMTKLDHVIKIAEANEMDQKGSTAKINALLEDMSHLLSDMLMRHEVLLSDMRVQLDEQFQYQKAEIMGKIVESTTTTQSILDVKSAEIKDTIYGTGGMMEKIAALKTDLSAENKVILEEMNGKYRKQDENITKVMRQQNTILYEAKYAKRLAAEGVFSTLFERAIQNSEWLKDAQLYPGRWAVGYNMLYVLYRILNEKRPKSILELGLGQSTRLISQYSSFYSNVTHVVVEHDMAWKDFLEKSSGAISESTHIMHLDLMTREYEGCPVIAYKNFDQALKGKEFDLILIDSPFGGDANTYSRIDVLMAIPALLKNSFIVLLDDCDRAPEMNTGERMMSTLDENRIPFAHNIYRGNSEVLAISSEDNRFYCTL